MAAMETALALVIGCVLAGTLVALLRKGRHRYCHTFGAYLALQLAMNLTYFVYPKAFERWTGWLIKETLYAAIRMALLAEVATLVFRALPRARARAQMLLLIAAVVLGVALLWRYDTRTIFALAQDITGRFAYVTAWSLMAILILVSWYRVPLHRLHKAILHGMLWLMVVHFAVRYTVPHWGVSLAGLAHNLAQLVVMLVWLRAVLSAEPVLETDEAAVIRYLQPWRSKP